MASGLHSCRAMLRRTSILVLTIALVGAFAFWRVRPRPAPTPESADARAAADPHLNSADRLAEVERIVAERNRAAGKDEDAFRADGWTMVKTDPPDARLTSYDPSLLAEGREDELRGQLTSTTAAPQHARRIARIALEAKEPKTRFAAVDALGHIHGDEAQAALLDLLTSGKLDPGDFVRQQIAPLLRPRDLDDGVALRMAALLDDPRVTATEKHQIAFTLALVSIRDGMTLPDDTLAALSPDARASLDQAHELVTRRIALHNRRN
ncbi:MAG TPA: hypothetical protein VKE22_13770 [Haliangiales bacterium]|nr:hypothetical protein [Haliangiales bacterium]